MNTAAIQKNNIGKTIQKKRKPAVIKMTNQNRI
jgi:hypothetical protein